MLKVINLFWGSLVHTDVHDFPFASLYFDDVILQL